MIARQNLPVAIDRNRVRTGRRRGTRAPDAQHVYQIDPADPATFAVVAALVLIVATTRGVDPRAPGDARRPHDRPAPRINCATLDFRPSSGRRSPRQSIRWPPDAAAGPVSADRIAAPWPCPWFFCCCNRITQVAGPLLTKLAIDQYLAKPDHPVHSPLDRWLAADVWTGLAQISALYLASLLIGFVCEFVETYLMQRTGQLAMFDLRRELMEHLQTPRRRLLRPQSGGPPDHARHHRRRRAERTVGLRPGDHPGRRSGARLRRHGDAAAEPRHDRLLLLAVLPFVVLVTAMFRRTVQQSYRRIRVAHRAHQLAICRST